MPPTVSAAIIAKDEEYNLDNCLASLAPHVDEVVVVDTGSTDRTREVAVRWGASVYQFDHRNHPEAFFLDDETTCRAFGAPPPFSGQIALGDFSAPRNESFDRARGDYIFWADADDVVEGAQHLRAIAADMAARGVEMGFMAYDYARDHLGRVFYRQWRERMVKRGVARWVNCVHEVLLPPRVVNSAKFDQVSNSHRRKADRRSIDNRNYKLLLRHLKAEYDAGRGDKVDPRTLFYLGQEARFIEPLRARGFYEEYLKRSGWCEERAAAHVALGHLCEFNMLGLPQDEAYARANLEYSTAAVEMPDNPDGLLGLARIAYLRNRHLDCVAYTERAFKVGNTDSMLGANPLDRTYRPHVYLNDALWKLGRLDEAIASCKSALAVCPDDPGVPGGASGMLTHNLRFFEQEKARREQPKPANSERPAPDGTVTFDKNEDVDALPQSNIPRDAFVIWAMQLWKHIAQLGDGHRAHAFLESLPPSVKNDAAWERMRASTARRFPPALASRGAVDGGTTIRINVDPAIDGERVARKVAHALDESQKRLSFVFWLGPAFEPWDATTPNTKGIGGSETACVEVAKNLARLGHTVIVYNDLPVDQTVHDGVTYVHYRFFAGADCDVFISSRQPGVMAVADKIKARLRVLWVHDIHCGPATPDMERWLLRFDRVLCLSEWHKRFFCSCYPTLHPDRVTVTRNGIDPARFDDGRGPGTVIAQKTNSLVWSSSPNRGLDTLLGMFPAIRARVPDAELHIAYGFDTWAKLTKGNPAEEKEIDRFRALIDSAVQHGGVHFHGRISQPELTKLWLRAKAWCYPSGFLETSCISSMEAMAAGCVPVCSKLAALPETVKHGVLIDVGADDHGIKSPPPGCGQQFVDATVRLLTDDAYRAPIAMAARTYALGSLSWSSLVDEWVAMFRRMIEEVEANPVPMWRSA